MVFCLAISSAMAFHCATTVSFSFYNPYNFLNRENITLGAFCPHSCVRSIICEFRLIVP